MKDELIDRIYRAVLLIARSKGYPHIDGNQWESTQKKLRRNTVADLRKIAEQTEEHFTSQLPA